MPQLPNVWTDPFETEISTTLRLDAACRFRKFQLPETLEAWKKLRPRIRKQFLNAMKVKVDHKLPLEFTVYGEIDKGSYLIRKVSYQTRPGVHATAALYLPKGEGPFPALLNLHGHWAQGHLAARVQERGHVFAQQGYAVLSPDAFGSGERSRQGNPYGEYHGGLLGGALMNVDETLAGCQLIDNIRAVDCLAALPCVDKNRIGCTGASGGGNQTMYLAAFDERIKCAMPLVSVGTYQSLVCGTNCVCEVIPGGLDIGEQSAILALTAPRPLNVCNAMHDINPTFHVPEAARSVTEARKIYKAYGASEKLTSQAFNSPHGYFAEAMEHAIGFFDYYLKGKGLRFPVALPEFTAVAEDEIRSFPHEERPEKVMPIDRFIQQKAEFFRRNTTPGSAADLRKLLKIDTPKIILDLAPAAAGEWEKHTIEDERKRLLPFLFLRRNLAKCRIIADPEGKGNINSEYLDEAMASGDSVLIFDHWGSGECGLPKEIFPINMKQHNLARALLWLGRTLMGEWCADYMLAAQFVRKELPAAEITITGFRDSGVAALFAATLLNQKNLSIRMVNSPTTLVPAINSPDIQKFFSMALCIPGIVSWGDIQHAIELCSGKVESIEPHAY